MNFTSEFIIQQSKRILNCYEETIGTSLRQKLNIPNTLDGAELAEQLYLAPIAILSHDVMIKDGKRDNIYNYANQTALNLFERSFEEQINLPSSRSTGTGNPQQVDRNNLLAETLAKGFVKFTTTRMTSHNKEVLLKDAILFNLFDNYGVYCGQSVVFYP